jgi:uncharacterized membrane protein YkoI
MKITIPFLCAGLFTLRLATAGAEEPAEKKLKQSEVPKAVLGAVTRKYPRAKLEKFGQETDEGKPIYEVEIRSGQDKVSIDVSPEGKILAEETTIPTSALPVPVKAGLAASKYKGWKIARAEKVITEEKEDAPSYEVIVKSQHERFEVVLAQDGRITKEEAKTAKDD